jgi:uncharacterized Zn-binding protein involved in type VI secretion
MPGPPAPFIPTPLPNFGRSADRLNEATTTVKIEGKKIAIKGSYYMSQPSPDVASKGTGGGIVSSSTQGKTEFVAPGSMNVKAEGKNIQLLGDAMTNNGGSPANSGTLPGNNQPPVPPPPLSAEELLKCIACKCDAHVNSTQPNLSCMRSGTVEQRDNLRVSMVSMDTIRDRLSPGSLAPEWRTSSQAHSPQEVHGRMLRPLTLVEMFLNYLISNSSAAAHNTAVPQVGVAGVALANSTGMTI